MAIAFGKMKGRRRSFFEGEGESGDFCEVKGKVAITVLKFNQQIR